ncbi:MAG: hypothetical protein ACRDOF_11435 [Gaiellaceae bacterium]
MQLAELQGGSRTSFGVPIYWQIVSRRGSARSVYRVGVRPAGFETTVPFGDLPSTPHFFYGVDVGEAGMGFTLDDLRRGQVLTSDYRYVSIGRYLDDARAACDRERRSATSWLAGISLVLLVAASMALLAGGVHRRRSIAGSGRRDLILVASVVTAIAVLGTLDAFDDPFPGPQIPYGKATPGRLVPRLASGERVLARFDSTELPDRTFATKQFEASGRYALYVGCDGISVQVSEAYFRPSVEYGARTVALCNPSIRLASGLSTTPSGTVVLGVRGHGTRWRVTIATR